MSNPSKADIWRRLSAHAGGCPLVKMPVTDLAYRDLAGGTERPRSFVEGVRIRRAARGRGRDRGGGEGVEGEPGLNFRRAIGPCK